MVDFVLNPQSDFTEAQRLELCEQFGVVSGIAHFEFSLFATSVFSALILFTLFAYLLLLSITGRTSFDFSIKHVLKDQALAQPSHSQRGKFREPWQGLQEMLGPVQYWWVWLLPIESLHRVVPLVDHPPLHIS